MTSGDRVIGLSERQKTNRALNKKKSRLIGLLSVSVLRTLIQITNQSPGLRCGTQIGIRAHRPADLRRASFRS